MRTKRSRVLSAATLVLGGFFAVNCLIGCTKQGAAASLKGTVKFGGQAVESGVIRLAPGAGTLGAGGASKITNGEFSIPSGETLKSGEHTVLIMATRSTGRKVQAPAIQSEVVNADGESGAASASSSPKMIDETEQYIPEKYNRASELTITLQPGENTKDWDLMP